MNEKERAVLAEQITENSIYKESLIIMRADLLEAFERSSFDQKEEREEIYLMMRTLNKFEKQIKKVITTGKLAINKSQ